MPTQPDVEIKLPSVVFVGRPFVVVLEVRAQNEVDLDFIDVKITGEQGWRLSKSQHAELTFPKLVRRVMEKGRLKVGLHRFSVELMLPEGSAPSHNISPAFARTFLVVHDLSRGGPMAATGSRCRYALPRRNGRSAHRSWRESLPVEPELASD